VVYGYYSAVETVVVHGYLQETIQLLSPPYYLKQFEVVPDLISYYMEIAADELIFGYIAVGTFP
jgi:hypothetical protein